MKKWIAITTALLLLVGSLGMTALAESPEPVRVFVSISDADGRLVLAQETVAVSDADLDGALTVYDALYSAHEANYDGGAAAGFGASYGDYGLSLDKLWGTANGGSFGYYVNNASAWSLADPVQEGDYVNAFVYTDLENWSDTYCYFDRYTAAAEAGETLSLTLSASGYDADWNPVELPVEGAVITVNGEKTAYTTDEAGQVEILLEAAGTYVISAVSDTATLVPPVCSVTVAGDPVESADTSSATQSVASVSAATESTERPADTNGASTGSAADSTTASTSSDSATASTGSGSTATVSPKTGDSSNAIVLLLGAVSLAAFLVVSVKRSRFNEK